VRHAATDVYQAAFRDRGQLPAGVHEEHSGQDEEGLLGGGMDM
jgi:hypothetical protein